MKGKKLLVGLSYIDRKYIEEAENDSLPTRNSLKKPLFIAALIALMLFMMGCAWVVMRLQHMTTDTPPFIDLWGEERSVISLQGFEGGKNYKAFQEWQTFLGSYDTDKKILYANNDFERPDAYYSYFCYSQEMVDKIAEICKKYNLEPLGKPWFYHQKGHLFDAVGIDTIFSETATPKESPFSGYCYNDGTFAVKGYIQLAGEWDYTVGYSLRSVQKTSFDSVYSSVGDLATYDQWEHTMKDGTSVLLALQDEGWIIVDREDCFVVVTAFGTPEDVFAPIPHDRAFVEAFCEAFDFSFQPRRVDPDKAYALQCEEEPHDYATLIQYMLAEQAEEYPNLKYALVDINGDGQEELLLQSKGSPYLTEHPIEENMFFSIISMRDGELNYELGGGYHYLCHGNVIESLSPFEGGEKIHNYYRYDRAFHQEPVDQIHVEDGKLYKWVPNSLISERDLEEITDEEANAIITQYPRLDLEFKSASEFRKERIVCKEMQ